LGLKHGFVFVYAKIINKKIKRVKNAWKVSKKTLPTAFATHLKGKKDTK